MTSDTNTGDPAAAAPSPTHSPFAPGTHCPKCLYAIGVPDSKFCPECGVGLRHGYVDSWTIHSRFWLKRLTFCMIPIAVLNLVASCIWPVHEMVYSLGMMHGANISLLSNFLLLIQEMWDYRTYLWPMYLTMLMSPVLLIGVLVGVRINLRQLKAEPNPKPDVAHAAWRRVFRMMLLAIGVSTAQLCVWWLQAFVF